MTKLFTLIFSVLSLGAVWLTYADTGLQTIDVSNIPTKSIRQGSSSSSSSGFYSSGGGYRHGK